MCRGANSIASAALTLLLVALWPAQSKGAERRWQEQNRRPQQQQQQRGFQPPPGKGNGFGNSASSNAGQENARQRQGLRVYGPGPHAGDWLRNNRGRPLNQQLQQLHNDPAFRKLPPQEQQRLEDRLRQFNSLTPAQQDRLLNNVDTMEHLPPDGRRQAQELYRRYQSLPFTRQQAVHGAVRELMPLSPEDRQRRLSSPEYRSRFTDNERDIISQQIQLPRPGEVRSYNPPPEE
jgi:hypothetical protein